MAQKKDNKSNTQDNLDRERNSIKLQNSEEQLRLEQAPRLEQEPHPEQETHPEQQQQLEQEQHPEERSRSKKQPNFEQQQRSTEPQNLEQQYTQPQLYQQQQPYPQQQYPQQQPIPQHQYPEQQPNPQQPPIPQYQYPQQQPNPQQPNPQQPYPPQQYYPQQQYNPQQQYYPQQPYNPQQQYYPQQQYNPQQQQYYGQQNAGGYPPPYQPNQGQIYTVYVSEEDMDDTLRNEPLYVRHGFIRKVYGLLCINLAIMFLILGIFVFVWPIKIFLARHFYLVAIPLALHFTILYIFVCCPDVQHIIPTNLILFFTLGVTGGMILGFLCIYTRTELVLLGFGITMGIVFLLTLFAFQTKWDITSCFIYPLILMFMLLIIGMCCLFIRAPLLHLVYCGIGVLLFTFLLIYDTQAIMGNKKYAYTPEDYIHAALNLFIDVQLLFTFIMGIMNATE